MVKALSPLPTRSSQGIAEREVLRVVTTLGIPEGDDAFEQARKEVLVWARNRSGGSLPPEAWEGKAFEHLTGGRTVLAVPLELEGGVVWALRADDPDKSVPGRIWTCEATLGRPNNQSPKLSVRLIASSREMEMNVNPHVPGFLHQIGDKLDLSADGIAIQDRPIYVRSEEEDLEALIALLQNPERRLPVIVATGDEREPDSASPLIDTESLARATFGLAHVFALPAAYTYALSDTFGKVRSVFHGAIRVYLRGFDASADPYEHRLYLGDVVRGDPEACEIELRRLAARESLRRTRLGHDVVSYAAVRSAATRLEQNKAADASDAERLAAAQRHIEALEEEVKDARSEADQSMELAATEEERARSVEAIQHGLRARVQTLEATLLNLGIEQDVDLAPPNSWDDFTDWCDERLAGRLVLASQARRGIKKRIFGDPNLAAQCLVWLASTCRKHRLDGGGNLANITIQEGIENAHCGGDTFAFDWQNRRLTADWHVKNGGNTRNPERCLRIYYCFDERTQQIVVADMPTHRRSGAT